MIMREHIRMYSGIVSLLLICSAAFFISETSWKAPKYSRVVISVISGVVIGLLMQHWLLDWSYFRGGFLLFPTLLAVILLLMCSIPVESNEEKLIKKSILKKCLEV